MRLKLLYNLLIIVPVIGYSQKTEFKVSPFINGVTSIKDGMIEAGPEFNISKEKTGRNFVIRPSVRMPLTNKNENLIQIDRFSSTWRGILAIEYSFGGPKKEKDPIRQHFISFQGEFGFNKFKYYPTGNKSNELKDGESSQAYEIKYVYFATKGKENARQYSPQIRVRYSKEWKASDEVGVVNPINGNGVVTTTNMVIDKPNETPTFSPAFSFQYYSGKGNFSYSPSLYYDFSGTKGKDDPFNSLARFRIEAWVFYYPIAGANVKIGITPFVSFRTKGTDKFNTVEYGGQISIKFGTTFLQFL